MDYCIVAFIEKLKESNISHEKIISCCKKFTIIPDSQKKLGLAWDTGLYYKLLNILSNSSWLINSEGRSFTLETDIEDGNFSKLAKMVYKNDHRNTKNSLLLFLEKFKPEIEKDLTGK